MNIRSFIAKCLLAACLAALAACGGGEGDSPLPPPTTVIQGLYTGTTHDGKEFLSIVKPTSNALQSDWYGLNFRSATLVNNPDIYSGTVSLGVNRAASVASTAFKAFWSGRLRTGSASLTGATQQLYSGTVNLGALTGPDDPAKTLSLNVTAPGSYQYSHAAQASELSGTWPGAWSDGISVKNPSSIEFSTSGAVTSIDTLINCTLTSLSLTPVPGVNLFSVSLTIPADTLCLRSVGHPSGVPLSGVAVIYASPVAGKSRRLDLMAVDSTGSGISFRGER